MWPRMIKNDHRDAERTQRVQLGNVTAEHLRRLQVPSSSANHGRHIVEWPSAVHIKIRLPQCLIAASALVIPRILAQAHAQLPTHSPERHSSLRGVSQDEPVFKKV